MFPQDLTMSTSYIQGSPRDHDPPNLAIKAVDTLQLLDQLDIVLLGGRRGDLILNGDLLPRIILIFLLSVKASRQQMELQESKLRTIGERKREKAARTWKAKVPGCVALEKSSPVPCL